MAPLSIIHASHLVFFYCCPTGYLSDVNGEWELDEDDPYQSNLDLCWHLSGSHSFGKRKHLTTVHVMSTYLSYFLNFLSPGELKILKCLIQSIRGEVIRA